MSYCCIYIYRAISYQERDQISLFHVNKNYIIYLWWRRMGYVTVGFISNNKIHIFLFMISSCNDIVFDHYIFFHYVSISLMYFFSWFMSAGAIPICFGKIYLVFVVYFLNRHLAKKIIMRKRRKSTFFLSLSLSRFLSRSSFRYIFVQYSWENLKFNE